MFKILLITRSYTNIYCLDVFFLLSHKTQFIPLVKDVVPRKKKSATWAYTQKAQPSEVHSYIALNKVLGVLLIKSQFYLL